MQQQSAQEKADLEEEALKARAETEAALGEVVGLQMERDELKDTAREIEATWQEAEQRSRQQLASLEEELPQKREATALAASDRDRLQEQVDSLTAANPVLDQEAEELRGQIAGSDADAASAAADAHAAREELAAFRVEAGQTDARPDHELAALEQALAEARAEGERLAERVAELEAARNEPSGGGSLGP